MKRTEIYNALVTQIASLRDLPYNMTIPVIELGLDNASNVPRQPAIFIAPAHEISVYNQGLPIKWEIIAEVYVYTKKSGNFTGVQNLLPMMDAIDLVLSPQTNQRPGAYQNTLGLPYVSSCAISGQCEIFGGYLDEQTIARIPIKIVTAG